MPYFTIENLPSSVRQALPLPAQEIYRAAFDRAWEESGDLTDRERISHQVAWAAVRRIYEKDLQGQWKKRS